jgi:AcrR family transcriptional regulator
MPRPKTQSDALVLEAALALMYERGPEALTFASLADRCGLSGATLVQRFESKARLRQSTLLYAWDRLDEETARRAAAVSRTPEGAIELLVGLSTLYGEIDSYAQMPRLLHEDLRDPVLRERAAAWQDVLCRSLDECFASVPGLPAGAGLMTASQWQGAHLLWSFDPQRKVEDFVEESLNRFFSVLMASGPGGGHRGLPESPRCADITASTSGSR